MNINEHQWSPGQLVTLDLGLLGICQHHLQYHILESWYSRMFYYFFIQIFDLNFVHWKVLKFFNGGYGNNSYSWKWKSKEGDPTYLLLLGGTRRSESQFVSQLGAHAGEGKVKLGKIQRSVIFNWSMRSCMIPNTIHIAMKPKSINHSKGKKTNQMTIWHW